MRSVRPGERPRPGDPRRLMVAFCAAAMIAIVLACAGPASHPAEGPGTSYPCGVWGVSCGDGACCPWGHVCGSDKAGLFNRCEPGYCCYEGDPMYGAAPDAGARKVKARRIP